MIGGKYYDLTPVYSWMRETSNSLRHIQGARAKITNPDEFLAKGWCGVGPPLFGYLAIYRVSDVMNDGLLVQKRSRLKGGYDYELGDPFFLTNYPGFKELTDNQDIQFLALRTGSYQYTDTTGAVRTVPCYDYGTPYVPPALTPEQIKAAQEAANARAIADKKKAYQAQANAVRWLQPQATNGDASAQCRLGLHYLNGQGCETNREQAIYWLQKSSDQGSTEASNILATLKR